MPKIYDSPKDNPQQRPEPERPEQRRNVGSGPDATPATRTRGVIAAIIIVVAFLILVALFEIAKGEELGRNQLQPAPADVVYQQVA